MRLVFGNNTGDTRDICHTDERRGTNLWVNQNRDTRHIKIIRLRGEWLLHSQDFSVTQILREINFGESRSSKIANFAIFGALNFVDLVNFSLQKVQKFTKIKKSESLKVLKWHILQF